jgi:hypothetical protein
MPDPVTEAEVDETAPIASAGDERRLPALASMRRYCGTCHQGDDPFPPNFLHGSEAQVEEQVHHCAERIFFRLDMWRLPASHRPETPMPPGTALKRWNMSPEQWTAHADLAMLKQYAADILKDGSDHIVSLKDLASQGYDNLRECLPPTETLKRTDQGLPTNGRLRTATSGATQGQRADERH